MPSKRNPEASHEAPIEFSSLRELGLEEETVLILENQFPLSNTPSKKQVEAAVDHFSALLFPNEKPHHGRVLGFANTDLIDLSYIVSTPEGKKFLPQYQYLHHLTGILFAQAPKRIGNAFMMYGGEGYINQFPNEYHQAFIQKLLVLPRVTENWEVSIFGGFLGQEYITRVREYVTMMAELPEQLNPGNTELAAMLSFFGIDTEVGSFLRKMAPTPIREYGPSTPISEFFLAKRAETRAELLRSSVMVGNPGLLLEYLEEYFVEDPKVLNDKEAKNELQYDLNNYQGTRVLEFIRVLKVRSQELFGEYAQQLLRKVAILQNAGLKVPQVVIEAISTAA